MGFFDFLGFGGGGGGGSIDVPVPEPLLSRGQESDIVNRLMLFDDTPNKPLGVASRSALMDRIDPNYIPQFFRNDVLNPFLSAQFRLGREQRDRDITRAEEQFQRLGAFFTPDMPEFTRRISERQNLNEQDFLSNLGMQGGQLAELLRTDAIARALGLETVTSGTLQNLLSLNENRQNTISGFYNTILGARDTEETTNPLGFIAGGGLNQLIGSIFGGEPGGGISVPFGQDNFLSADELAWQNKKAGFFPGSGGGGGSGGGLFGLLDSKESLWKNAGQVAMDPQSWQQAAALLGMFCWVAAAVFPGGWNDPKTHDVRFYILYVGPRWFYRLYLKHGQRFAAWLTNKPLIRALIRPVFEVLALLGRQAQERWIIYA